MEASAIEYRRPGGVLRMRLATLRLQPDERLVTFVRRGNHAAFGVLVTRYESRLLSFCRQLLHSREDAEDVLQDVFAAAYKAMLADERPIVVRPWLYRIARNRCLNHIRRISAVGVESIEEHYSEHQPSASETVTRREELRQLVEDIRSLPEAQRAALLLRELEALSYEEIALALDKTVPSVKSLLIRARRGLAERAEARSLSCVEVAGELTELAAGERDGLSRPVRWHLELCTRCAQRLMSVEQTQRGRSLPLGARGAGALAPALPLFALRRVALGSLLSSARAGSGQAAAGAAPALSSGSALLAGSSPAALLSSGAGSLAAKAAAALAAAAIGATGAVAVGGVPRRPVASVRAALAAAHVSAAAMHARRSVDRVRHHATVTSRDDAGRAPSSSRPQASLSARVPQFALASAHRLGGAGGASGSILAAGGSRGLGAVSASRTLGSAESSGALGAAGAAAMPMASTSAVDGAGGAASGCVITLPASAPVAGGLRRRVGSDAAATSPSRPDDVVGVAGADGAEAGAGACAGEGGRVATAGAGASTVAGGEKSSSTSTAGKVIRSGGSKATAELLSGGSTSVGASAQGSATAAGVSSGSGSTAAQLPRGLRPPTAAEAGSQHAPAAVGSHPAPGTAGSHPAPATAGSHPAPGTAGSHPAPATAGSQPAPAAAGPHPAHAVARP